MNNTTDDHFNWPSLQRKDLMSNTNNLTEVTRYKRVQVRDRTSSSLHTDDIQFSKPFLRSYQYVNKESSINKVIGEVGEQKQQLLGLIAESKVLKVDDIQGAKPQKLKFITSRNCNPLEPSYQLPTFQSVQEPPTKFIRDTLNVDDIQGAKSKEPYFMRPRTIYPQEEISGSRTRQRLIPKDKKDQLDVQDINHVEGYTWQRVTNPQEPQYKYQIDDEGSKEFGNIPGTKSKILHQERQNKPLDSLLNIKDIRGAYADSIRERQNLLFKQEEQRKQTNNIKDIPGALPGTLQRGIKTGRATNPLQPTYQILGATEDESDYKMGTQQKVHHKAKQINQDILSQFKVDQIPKADPKETRSARSQSVQSKSSHKSAVQKLDAFIIR